MRSAEVAGKESNLWDDRVGPWQKIEEARREAEAQQEREQCAKKVIFELDFVAYKNNCLYPSYKQTMYLIKIPSNDQRLPVNKTSGSKMWVE